MLMAECIWLNMIKWLSRIVGFLKQFDVPFFLIGLLFTLWGGYVALFSSPQDYQQGESVRLMYLHVPASWGALSCYTIMAIQSVLFLYSKNIQFYLTLRALTLLGFALSAISLGTGSLWGYFTWGSWWVWDARLTSMLILCFTYLGLLFLQESGEYRTKLLSVICFITILGWLNIPIVKYSVEWWYTLHQPSTISILGKPKLSMDSSMLFPLILMTLGYFGLFFGLFLARLKVLTLELKIHHISIKRYEF